MGRGSRPQIHHCIEKDAVNLPATAHIAGSGRWVQRWSPAWLATAAGAAPAGAQYRGAGCLSVLQVDRRGFEYSALCTAAQAPGCIEGSAGWPPDTGSIRTLGQEAVPQAMAATAWAPPASSTWVTPALRAQYSTSGEMLPSRRGGVARTTVWHPAIPAGPRHSLLAAHGV